jgi:hypothetical protein
MSSPLAAYLIALDMIILVILGMSTHMAQSSFLHMTLSAPRVQFGSRVTAKRVALDAVKACFIPLAGDGCT